MQAPSVTLLASDTSHRDCNANESWYRTKDSALQDPSGCRSYRRNICRALGTFGRAHRVGNGGKWCDTSCIECNVVGVGRGGRDILVSKASVFELIFIYDSIHLFLPYLTKVYYIEHHGGILFSLCFFSNVYCLHLDNPSLGASKVEKHLQPITTIGFEHTDQFLSWMTQCHPKAGLGNHRVLLPQFQKTNISKSWSCAFPLYFMTDPYNDSSPIGVFWTFGTHCGTRPKFRLGIWFSSTRWIASSRVEIKP